MALGLLKKVIGDSPEKELRRLGPAVAKTNALESEMSTRSDSELRGKTDEFRERLAEGEAMDDLLPQAFALVRETSKRRIGLRHFDVQLLGGIVLHEGKIAEMKTGEGKTLVATLPLYLNALEGLGAHLVTQNDYLAKRDTQWMGPLYHSLGLSVGVLQHDDAYLFDPAANLANPSLRYLKPVPRAEAYNTDIVYGTNNEFGFDYLRDNMVSDLSRVVQRRDSAQHYAIVDEVDNLLIDEARTPLIISGPAEETEEIYKMLSRVVPRLQSESDYVVDIKHKSVSLTEDGAAKVEKTLNIKNLYDDQNYRLTRFLDAALKANVIYQRDRDYVVKDGEIIIVDEFTGRLMQGRRWADGLHQAVEAKEGVRIQRESVTYATITLQNYFRLYQKLAGMTGTAYTEREEFDTIYKLDVAVIPTNLPMVREDSSDMIFRMEAGKFRVVVQEIEEMHASGRPVLVGTVSIESSELLASLLKGRSTCRNLDCRHHHKVCPLKEPQVLNAKQHEREAAIVAQAGRHGAVTIATNMAGRGTDIILGGNPQRLADEIAQRQGVDLIELQPEEAEKIRDESRKAWEAEHEQVVKAGGLHIVGTERHEARRIDNQLRGRAGRQGDPGSSRFFVSFGDDVMRRFTPQWVPDMLKRMGMEEDTPLESNRVSGAIEQAQTKVEGYNFDIRKHVVEYDDIMNRQRDLIYTERRKILEGSDFKTNIQDMVQEELDLVLDAFAPEGNRQEWDIAALLNELKLIMPLPPQFTEERLGQLKGAELREEVAAEAEEAYAAKEEELGADRMRVIERLLMLQTIDRLWVYHLTALDEMRHGAGLRGYGGQDPLTVYKREAHDMWQQLSDHIRQSMVRRIFHLTLAPAQSAPSSPKQPQQVRTSGPAKEATAAAAGGRQAGTAPASAPNTPKSGKTGRNAPCPCGSGRKYKKCHGGVLAA